MARTDRLENFGSGASKKFSSNVRVINPKNNTPKKIPSGTRFVNTDKPSKAEARANARGLKAANEPKKVPVENISKPATRVFGTATLKGRGKPKMVVPGSKAEKKLKEKSKWAENYEKKSSAKADQSVARAEAKYALKLKNQNR